MSNGAGKEKTFRSYSQEDAARYAQHRQQYSEALYQSVLSYHTSTGGKLDKVVDVGCGPGMATFKLAETFNSVVGLDPGEAMIATARSLLESESEQLKDKIRFDVSTAEDISPSLIPDSSVDLISAATCAHWFEMSRFWPTAARILKPGGTVAIWTSRAASVHPSIPNAAAINAAMQEIEDKELAPYIEPGNQITRELYANMSLPWTLDSPELAFDKNAFVKKFFGTTEDEEPFFDSNSNRLFDMDTVEQIIATNSPVTRWRQAHPELVGTDADIVKRMRRIVEELLHEAGVEKGKELVKGGTAGVLLLVKRKA